MGAGPGDVAGAVPGAPGPGADARRGHPGQPVRQDDGTGGPHGYDGAKKVNGRKRHVLVDTLGLLLKARVTPADVSDRAGAAAPLLDLGGASPRLTHGGVDANYRGPFLDWVRASLGITLGPYAATAAGSAAGCPRGRSRRSSPPSLWCPAGGWWR